MLRDQLNQRAPVMLAVLRIMAGFLFLAHGTQKFLWFPAGERAGSGWAFADPAAVAGIVELIAGTMIALGLFTRLAAFLASGTMAGAFFHRPSSAWLLAGEQHGRRAILYCFIFLYLVFAGAGPFSLDATRASQQPR